MGAAAWDWMVLYCASGRMFSNFPISAHLMPVTTKMTPRCGQVFPGNTELRELTWKGALSVNSKLQDGTQDDPVWEKDSCGSTTVCENRDLRRCSQGWDPGALHHLLVWGWTLDTRLRGC